MPLPTLRSGTAVAALVFVPLFLTSRYTAAPGVTADTPPSRPGPLAGHAAETTPSHLRVLYTRSDDADGPSPIEKKLLRQFSRTQGLKPVWIPVKDGWHLLQGLQEGRGDVAVPPPIAPVTGPDTPVPETLPWGMSRQQVVGREGSGAVHNLAELGLRQIALRPDSPAWSLLQPMLRKHPAMDLVAIPAGLSDRQVLERVKIGRYDLAVLDSLALQSYLPYYPDLKVQLGLGKQHARRWLIRPDAADLQTALNRFLNRKHLELNMARVYREDLPQLQQRKMLRLITSRSPVNYYFDHGRLKGFEYDLIKRFARQHNMRVDVVIASTDAEMRALLRQGRGDVIAASLPAEAYAGAKGVKTSHPYNYATPVLVGRANGRPLHDITDLAGRTVWLPAESPWYGLLQSIHRRGIGVKIRRAPPEVNTEAALFRVARGMYDLTVIGSQSEKAEFARQLNLKAQFNLSGLRPLVWAVRQSDTQLLSALNAYIDQEYRQGFYNVVYNKYIDHPEPQKASAELLTGVSELSPFDGIVRDYAERYGFDWRLIVAQMYQESRFDPAAVSYAGARGLMQLLPAAAEQVGVEHRDDPAKNIRGGIRYLNYLRSRFEESDLPLEVRTWFTLAAYNAGYNRVSQARRLAGKMHLNPDRWFDNVEKAMLVMARPRHKDGSLVRTCRCGQTVVYVREIRTLYNNYVRLTQSVRTAEAGTSPEHADSSTL
jgi:membrane-bound lytic murein transglycosylase F